MHLRFGQREVIMARIVDPRGRELEIVSRFVNPLDKHILDIGCGDGRTTRRLAACGARVVGVDPDQATIDVARARRVKNDQCQFLAADATTLDLPPESVDVILFSRSL